MAVEDKYVDSDLVAGKLAQALKSGGAEVFAMVATLEVAAADDDGSVYRLFKNLPGNLVPLKIEIANDAITGGTDYELGLYETGVGGAAKDIDCLMGTTTMASARARGSEISGMSAVAVDSPDSTLYELAGDTLATSEPGYDLALTANTVGTAAGTITVIAWFAQH